MAGTQNCTGSRRTYGSTRARNRTSRSTSPRGGQFDFVWLSVRTPHGGRVCGQPNEIKKNIPTRKILPLVFGSTRAVQFHPDGGQFDFARSSTRTPHGAYVLMSRRNQEKYPREIITRTSRAHNDRAPRHARHLLRACAGRRKKTVHWQAGFPPARVPPRKLSRPGPVPCAPGSRLVPRISRSPYLSFRPVSPLPRVHP